MSCPPPPPAGRPAGRPRREAGLLPARQLTAAHTHEVFMIKGRFPRFKFIQTKQIRGRVRSKHTRNVSKSPEHAYMAQKEGVFIKSALFQLLHS